MLRCRAELLIHQLPAFFKSMEVAGHNGHGRKSQKLVWQVGRLLFTSLPSYTFPLLCTF